MRSFGILFGLQTLLVVTALAKGDGNKSDGTSLKAQCSQMSKLAKLSELATNTTKLDTTIAKNNLTDEEATAFKAKVANATTTLAGMQGNATLVSSCEVVAAEKKLKSECDDMKDLSKMINIANNQTALDAYAARKNLTQAQIERFKERATNATAKLDALNANSTLVSSCGTLQKAAASGSSTSSASSAKATSAGIRSATIESPYSMVVAMVGVGMYFMCL